MKALILGAGEGTRLRPLTDDRPKCMVEYEGKPILDRIIETMHSCGLHDIVVLSGYREEMIRRSDIRRCTNPLYASTNMVWTMFCAEYEMDDDLIVSYGDIVYRTEVLQSLIDSDAPFSVVIDKNWKALWLSRMEDPLNDAETLRLGPNGSIIELGKKPRALSDIEGQYIGLFKIKKEALPQVRDFYHSLDRRAEYDGRPFEKMFMTSFIQAIIDNLMPVKAVPIHGGWIEIDSASDLHCRML